MEKGRISLQQMSLLLYSSLAFNAVLTIPSTTGVKAGRDLWISPIWASFVGLFVLLVMIWLQRRYPAKTIIQYSERLAGTVMGKIIGFIVVFYFLHTNSLILREYGEFISEVYLVQTPLIIILGGMVLLVSVAVRSGLETLGRLAQLLLPGTLIVFLGLILMSTPDWNLRRALPIMEKGLVPSLQGAIVPSGWNTVFILLSFMLPFVKEQKRILMWGLITWASILLSLFVASVSALFIFGENVTIITYPFMEVVRYIRIGDFLQRLDALLLVVWVTGTFLQLCIIQYCVVLGTAQWFKMSNYRTLALPLGYLWVVLAMWGIPNLQALRQILGSSNIIFNFLVILIAPLLAVLELMKKKRRRQRPEGEALP